VGSTQPFQLFLVSFAFFMIIASSLSGIDLCCQSRETHGINPDPADLPGFMPGRYFLTLACPINLLHHYGLLSIHPFCGLPMRLSLPLDHPSHQIFIRIELDSFIPCGYHTCTSLGSFLLAIVR
jgi:hypothetical protein